MPRISRTNTFSRVALAGLALFFCLVLTALGYAADNASFVSQSVPTSMIAGQTYNVSVTMKNTGTTTWTSAANYKLGSQNPRDNANWGLGRVNLSGTDKIAPNQSKTFSFTAKAPATAGVYNFQWKMLKEGAAWFGSLSTNVAVTVTVKTNSPPSLGTISPASGSSSPNQAINFTTTYSDADGWQNIQYVHLLINATINAANCFYGYYNQNANKLYVMDDAGTTWLGGYAPGSSNTIENSYVKLNYAQTTVSGSGNTMTVNWNITFKSTFTGAKNTYLYVKDDANAYANWTQKGTWKINQPPVLSAIGNKTVSENSSLTFTLSATDPDNDVLTYSVTNLPQGASFNSTTRVFSWTPTYIQSGTYSNIVFSVTDGLLIDSESIAITVTNVNRPPVLGIITPASGSSSPSRAVTFTTTYSDADGWQDINYVHLLINAFGPINPSEGFLGMYQPNANKLYLYDNNSAAWIGGYAPGSSNTIENSYAKLDCVSTVVSGSGNNLTIQWKITFKPALTGSKNTYLFVRDLDNAYDGWAQKGDFYIFREPLSLPN